MCAVCSQVSRLTADLGSLIGESLDLILGQNTQYNDTVFTLFETLLGLLEGFRIYQRAANSGPTGIMRDLFVFGGLQHDWSVF